jgi:ferredoxin-NADP reductase
MRDDDPGSLNDDFVRTFTISSTPSKDHEKESEFEMTIRNVGTVTRFLFQQNERAGLEIGALGVGGEFKIEKADGRKVVFVAGGVGVTPLLGQVGGLYLEAGGFKLIWAVRSEDVGLVYDTFRRYHGLGACTTVFLTDGGTDGDLTKMKDHVKSEAEVVERRMTKSDIQAMQADTWYVCAGKGMRKIVTGWLEGQKVVFEDFDY